MPAPKGHAPYPGCETGGRPTKYTKEFIEGEADAFEKWMKEPGSIFFKRFAIDRGYHPNRLTEWTKANKKFNGIYRLAKHRQESRLINGGLKNQLNSTIVKLVLSNTHGWTDRQQLSGAVSNPLQFLLELADGGSKELVNGEE